MDYHFILGILAGLCSVTAISFYVPSILRGETKPNRATWIIWNITNVILFASYFSVGARPTVILPAVYVINGFIVLMLSLRYGVSSWNKLDIASLVVAGLSLVVWFLTQSALVALLMNLLMDAVGYLPTIRKAYVDPSSESKKSWFFIFLGTCFNLVALNQLTFAVVIYPIVMFTMNGILLSVLVYKTRRTI